MRTNNYIETRPEFIEAIHKSIEEKWNPICMCGYFKEEPVCELCVASDRAANGVDVDCKQCPLERCGDHCETWGRWIDAIFCDRDCEDYAPAPDEAEEMVELLISLLPPSERKRYEP